MSHDFYFIIKMAERLKRYKIHLNTPLINLKALCRLLVQHKAHQVRWAFCIAIITKSGQTILFILHLILLKL